MTGQRLWEHGPKSFQQRDGRLVITESTDRYASRTEAHPTCVKTLFRQMQECGNPVDKSASAGSGVREETIKHMTGRGCGDMVRSQFNILMEICPGRKYVWLVITESTERFASRTESHPPCLKTYGNAVKKSTTAGSGGREETIKHMTGQRLSGHGPKSIQHMDGKLSRTNLCRPCHH